MTFKIMWGTSTKLHMPKYDSTKFSQKMNILTFCGLVFLSVIEE